MLKALKYLIVLVIITLLFALYYVFNTNKMPKGSFTVVVLPDTQFYSESHPDIFCSQTEWIVNNIKKLNIVFVSQLGDIVNDGGKIPKQWETAKRCMSKLDGKVPYNVIPGNHDSEVPLVKESGFKSYSANFSKDFFSKYSWYKGGSDDNVNNYQIISPNGFKIMFVNLGIEPSNDALSWAEKVIKENPNIYTIFTTHKYLSDTSRTPENIRSYSKDGNTGLDIWNKLISKNCSIKLVLSGHFHDARGENLVESENSCGGYVFQVLQDYQAQEKGGDGKLRIYTFNPKENVINVSTYSPYTNTFYNDEISKFDLPLYQ